MKNLTLLIILLSLYSCQPADEAREYDFPDPVDTTDKPIVEQEKKQYQIDGVYFDNQFDAARLNGVDRKNDSTFVIRILPENEPINHSPWYAFKVQADSAQDFYLELNYGEFHHRYSPKTSSDGDQWEEISNGGWYNEDSTAFSFPISVTTEPLWISAQEIFNTTHLKDWCNSISESGYVNQGVAGQSRKGRDLRYLDIYKETKTDKKVLIIFSRQHPPEVTGFFALQSFLDAMINSDRSEEFFDDFRILVYPMLNPDGVDMGHWRHNTGGVDLNRDWAYYNQAEVKKIANHAVKDTYDNNSDVVFGFDFHSTWEDIYYTQAKEELKTATTDWFRIQWFERLENRIPDYKVNESPSGLGRPVSKSWFYTQFGAESMTYEIGDRTPRDRIKLIGKVAGEEMINVLLENKDKL